MKSENAAERLSRLIYGVNPVDYLYDFPYKNDRREGRLLQIKTGATIIVLLMITTHQSCLTINTIHT